MKCEFEINKHDGAPIQRCAREATRVIRIGCFKWYVCLKRYWKWKSPADGQSLISRSKDRREEKEEYEL